MYEPNLYETDDELEQALYAAFGREPAPDTLIMRVEQRLLRRPPCTGCPDLRFAVACRHAAPGRAFGRSPRMLPSSR